jgi:predicted porin
MKRSMIALAAASVFATPVLADVTLSGNINAGPAVVHSGEGSTNAANSLNATGGAAQQGVTRTGINTNYSNVTIGSMEDLGGGLKLDFAFQIIAPINSNSSVVNRNSHIGLVGDQWGGVWYGTNENLYERYFYTADPLDGAAGIGGNLSIMGSPGYGTVFDAPAGNPTNCATTINGVTRTGCAGFYRRQENSVWYDSPNWGGFTFGAYTTLSAYRTNGAASLATPNDPRIWGVGAKYVGPVIPIQAWVAYESHKDLYGLNVITGTAGTATTTKDHGIQVGAGYTLGDLFLFANFEQLKYKADGLAVGLVNEYKRNAWSIGGKWNVPTGYIGAQYMQAQNGKCEIAGGGGCNAGETAAKSVGVGYYHTLSKQTQAYVMAQYIKNDDLNFYTVAGGTGVPNNLGANIWAATVGLKHSF